MEPVCVIPASRSRLTDDQEDTSFLVHKHVFHGDAKQLSSLLDNDPQSIDVNQKDVHGNTPLHLAVMLGRQDCLQVLLERGAKIAVKNGQGWTPLAEAVSYGNRDIITTLLKNQKQQTRDELNKRRPELIKGLESMGNFYMELRWDFQSWIPLVSRILPSDVCKIYKKGANIRVDTTLVDFNDMKWERGDVSFLFRGKGCSTRHGRHRHESSGENGTPSYALIVMDNKLRVFQRVKHQEREQEVEDEVDILMSNDIVSAQINTKHLNFDRVSTGWLFKSDKTETVGSFLADFYAIQGFVVESRKRREHLTDEDLQKNKAIMESLTKGPEVANGNSPATQSSDSSNFSLPPPVSVIPRRLSLPPPSCVVSWSEYISSPPGQFPVLGRHPICKVSNKTFKATLAMSQDFPMTVDALINLLEVIAPFKQFKKMREFVEMKLPPGFPVKIEIPILPTVTAKITFQEFIFDENLPSDYFDVPLGYSEDPNRFPDL